MILEIAQIAVKAGMETEFEAGVAKATQLFQRAKGCRSMELVRSIEMPSQYRLMVGWGNTGKPYGRFSRFGRFSKLAWAGGPLLRNIAGSGACRGGGVRILTRAYGEIFRHWSNENPHTPFDWLWKLPKCGAQFVRFNSTIIYNIISILEDSCKYLRPQKRIWHTPCNEGDIGPIGSIG